MSEHAFDPDRVTAVTFDSYGTLVDTGAAARVLDGLVDDPPAVAHEWRQNALEYSIVAGHIEEYRTYYQLHLDGLRDALAVEGVDLDDGRLRELNDVYHDLDPFDDVRSGFERLAAGGYDPSIISNGDPPMLDSLVETTDIGPFVTELVSADDVHTLKPDQRLYEHAAQRLDRKAREVVHVAAHWMDIQGARHAGMQGVWLDRGHTPYASFGPRPSTSVDTIGELCELLDV